MTGLPLGQTELPVMGQLQVDDLLPASRTRVLVELIQDGMGLPLRVPVILARGAHSGPVFGITAALHGNEINGIPVIHRLMEGIDLRALRGTVVAVPVVNVQSFLANHRLFVDGKDLNHVMPGRADGNVSEVFAHRFLNRIVTHFDYLIDLHTASFGRVNSLYIRTCLTDPVAAKLARVVQPEIILHNPPSDGTLRGAAMDRRIPAITVEIGNPQVFQPGKINSTVVGIRRVLGEVGMLPRRRAKDVPPPVLCERSYWLYTDQGGLLETLPPLAARVSAGQVVARHYDIFGEHLCDYEVPEEGIVIGKSVNPVGQTGARILHLGIVVQDDGKQLSSASGDMAICE